MVELGFNLFSSSLPPGLPFLHLRSWIYFSWGRFLSTLVVIKFIPLEGLTSLPSGSQASSMTTGGLKEFKDSGLKVD